MWRQQIACNRWIVRFAERLSDSQKAKLSDASFYVGNKFNREEALRD
jgi:hypothetical protein